MVRNPADTLFASSVGLTWTRGFLPFFAATHQQPAERCSATCMSETVLVPLLAHSASSWLLRGVGGGGDNLAVIKRPADLMAQIERDLLDEKPLDTLLRKLILLGGNAGSPELRNWASLELRGYGREVELPLYRTVSAPLQVDGAVPGGIVRHETIGAMDIPDFARDEINEQVPLRMGVSEIHSMVDQHRNDRIVKLQPPGAPDLVAYMNGTREMNGHITALYWSVSTIALAGVLDQIRTRLAELIAELRSATPQGQNLPTPTQAANAVNFVINGLGNRVSIAQAADGSTITAAPEEVKPRSWTRAKLVGAAAVGLATIAGTVIAALQLPIW